MDYKYLYSAITEMYQTDPNQKYSDIARNIIKKFKVPTTVDTFRKVVRNVIQQANINKPQGDNPELTSTIKEDKDTKEITTITKRRIKTLEDLIEVCEINTDTWSIQRWLCNAWSVGRKEIIEDLTWTNGKKEGTSKDTGKIEVEPLFQVKAWLIKKVKEIELREIKEEMIEEMKQYSPKYSKIIYKNIKDGYLFEIGMPDIHLGKLSWGLESGEDSDIKLTEQAVIETTLQLMQYASMFPIKRILFPIGNDFFNVDNKENTTSHGTPQQEDTRWRKTFTFGRHLMIEVIDMLSTIAPVDVKIVPGNHDYERSFYLGDSLECWYHNNKNVVIDNGPKTRKYYSFGKCLIGLTHGYSEKLTDLPLVMATEEKEAWNNSVYREWHTGDKHHEKELSTKPIDEIKGVTIRILRALCTNDQWHYEKGFVGQIRSGEGFLWHPEKGRVGLFSANL